jgi:hypothetical protein
MTFVALAICSWWPQPLANMSLPAGRCCGADDRVVAEGRAGLKAWGPGGAAHRQAGWYLLAAALPGALALTAAGLLSCLRAAPRRSTDRAIHRMRS